MKHIIIIGTALILLTCLSFGVHAAEAEYFSDHHGNDASGFSWRFDVGGFYMSTKSHLEPGDDNKQLDNLDQNRKREGEFLPVASFELNYFFEDGPMIYLGMPFEDEPRPTLGIAYELPQGIEIDFSLFYSMPEEVWEDPYIMGVKRKETDENRYGGKLSIELADFELSYELEKINVDKDKVGQRFSALRREGILHQFETAYEIELAHGFELVPVIGCTLANIDGKSNEYKGYNGGIELRKLWQDVELQLSLEAGRNDYDTVHPIFSKTRKDDIFETMVMISWYNPMGYDRFALRIGGGYEKNDSNIDFYDGNAYSSFITIGYQFGGRP